MKTSRSGRHGICGTFALGRVSRGSPVQNIGVPDHWETGPGRLEQVQKTDGKTKQRILGGPARAYQKTVERDQSVQVS
jgi:hypothetical protein